MQTKKMSLANIQGKLSRTEMKNIMAGTGGQGCLSQYSYSCSTTGGGNASDHCCGGYKCVLNGTGTGTICM